MPVILVVDNNEGVRQVIGAAVPHFNFTVKMAASGAEALKISESEKIDFALLDMEMPAMDGPQTLAALKSIDPNIVCCLMSGSRPPTPADLSNAVGFLQKPFSFDTLRKLIIRHLCR
jgi:CheY-like chemotaxis protein